MVELKILFRIQEEVGFGIKIQDLFDLVIGTSTGMFQGDKERGDEKI